MLALEANGYPDREIEQFYDPWSTEPRERALVCLLLDNDLWCTLQRGIISMPAWSSLWSKLGCVPLACCTVPARCLMNACLC